MIVHIRVNSNQWAYPERAMQMDTLPAHVMQA